jgi:hypothetical protein
VKTKEKEGEDENKRKMNSKDSRKWIKRGLLTRIVQKKKEEKDHMTLQRTHQRSSVLWQSRLSSPAEEDGRRQKSSPECVSATITNLIKKKNNKQTKSTNIVTNRCTTKCFGE